MLKVIIHWTYFKQDHWFSSFSARVKKDLVYFYDYDDVVWFVINQLSYAELQRLRINIYNTYHKQIKFTKFSEQDVNWEVFEWYKIESPIIDVDVSDFALLLANRDLIKKYFVRDEIRERYFFKSDFINYVKFNVV